MLIDLVIDVILITRRNLILEEELQKNRMVFDSIMRHCTLHCTNVYGTGYIVIS